MNWLFSRLADAFWPKRCVFCRKLHPDGLCESCFARELLRERAVVTTGSQRCIAAVWYRGAARGGIQRFKFKGKRVYAEAFARLMEEAIRAHGGVGYTCVTWVPVSKRRLRKRGYDQCRLLAEQLAPRLGIPCVPLLAKTRDNPTQNKLKSDGERDENVRNVFSVPDPTLVRGQKILLVDDILTSGATIREASRELLNTGADAVDCVVLARSR